METLKKKIVEVLREENISMECSDIKDNLNDENISQEDIKKIIKEDLNFAGEKSYFRVSLLNKNSFGLNNSFSSEDYEFLNKISLKKESQEFEKKVKSLLEKLEFEHVEGARDNFIVGGHQIDVCAKHENSVLVIECKMSQEIKIKNLKTKQNGKNGREF